MLIAAFAHGTELVPALVLPTSAPIDAAGGQVALGALVTGGPVPRAALTLRSTAGITDALAVNAALREPDGGLLLGVRYLFVVNEHLRIAPFVFGAASDELVSGASLDTALAAGLGVAVDAGWTTTRFDLSLPLLATGDDPLAVPLLGLSSGISVQIGRGLRLRLALESTVAPALSGTYARERWYLQATALYSVSRAEPAAAVEAGLRF